VKNRITKYFIFILGLSSLIIFISVRFEKSPVNFINKKVIWEEDYGGYGDLYNLNLLDTFKVRVYEKDASFLKSGNKNNINESDFIFFGDSFLGGSASGKLFFERFGDSLGVKTFFSNDDDPLVYLSKVNYIKKDRKKLIFEIVERRIIEYFSVPPRTEIIAGTLIDIKKTLFPSNLESKYNYLLQKSILTYDLYKLISNIKFILFGFMNPATPKYSLNPLFLFYFQEVNDKSTSFYYKFTESEINTVCNNIAIFKKLLEEKYNLELIFLPIPNKYTIYNTILNHDKYNDLLPVLYNKLEEKGISVIELYKDFKSSKDYVYHNTDTHWNSNGEDIAINKLIKIFRK